MKLPRPASFHPSGTALTPPRNGAPSPTHPTVTQRLPRPNHALNPTSTGCRTPSPFPPRTTPWTPTLSLGSNLAPPANGEYDGPATSATAALALRIAATTDSYHSRAPSLVWARSGSVVPVCSSLRYRRQLWPAPGSCESGGGSSPPSKRRARTRAPPEAWWRAWQLQCPSSHRWHGACVRERQSPFRRVARLGAPDERRRR